MPDNSSADTELFSGWTARGVFIRLTRLGIKCQVCLGGGSAFLREEGRVTLMITDTLIYKHLFTPVTQIHARMLSAQTAGRRRPGGSTFSYSWSLSIEDSAYSDQVSHLMPHSILLHCTNQRPMGTVLRASKGSDVGECALCLVS